MVSYLKSQLPDEEPGQNTSLLTPNPMLFPNLTCAEFPVRGSIFSLDNLQFVLILSSKGKLTKMNAVNYFIYVPVLLIKGVEITRKKEGSAFTDHLLHANVLYRIPHLILTTSLGDKYYPHSTDKKVDRKIK